MSTFGERIRKARENKNLLQSELAKLIDVKSSGVISNWEKDLNKPDADKIVRLCAALDISASYLLDYHGNDSFQVSDEELEHIKKYRTLDEHGKDIVDTVLDKEYERVQAPAAPAAKVYEYEELFEYLEPVSAGTGARLDLLDAGKNIKVISNVYTKKADFVLRVTGHSMEPRFHDGDRLLVQEADEVEIGDIGVWIIEGESFVKKCAENYLSSLNPDYPPIYPGDVYSQRCIGHVVGVLDPEWVLEE